MQAYLFEQGSTASITTQITSDEYLAELDYIEVVEQMKEGYEEDIPEADKKLDKKELGKDDEESDEEEPTTSEEEENASKSDKEDDDFRPGYIGKRLRKREKTKKDKDKPNIEDNKEKDSKEKDTKDVKEKDKDKESSKEPKDAFLLSKCLRSKCICGYTRPSLSLGRVLCIIPYKSGHGINLELQL
ncbi:hypothetical protein HF086_005388 [Spodoptera exigua]|uniref:Uncharacterized protein n=1 Tax=Spodoptera exigua TaxID=7107 RepID=A0A922M2J3_SPOEX|nr:hypothetical protein HF086_005388 [Spodoptera exigua]